MTLEALEVLYWHTSNEVCPQDLLQDLLQKETWGEYLEQRKTDKARASLVGRFFQSFQPTSKHTEGGTKYNLADLVDKLNKHIPPSLHPKESVSVSASPITTGSSVDCNLTQPETEVSVKCQPDPSMYQPDTSKNGSVSQQAFSFEEASVTADTLTPFPEGTEGLQDEEGEL